MGGGRLAADARAAPELALAEVSNILRRLERAGEITRLEATYAHRDLLRLDLELFSFTPFAERVWALRHNLTAYDAWYVALAEALDCPLMTLDGRLSRASGPSVRSLFRRNNNRRRTGEPVSRAARRARHPEGPLRCARGSKVRAGSPNDSC